MKTVEQMLFDNAVSIADLTQEKIWLKRELQIAEDKIRDLYDVIDRHEKELRVFRNKARQEVKS